MATQPVLFRAGWRYLKTFGGARWYLFPWDMAIRDDGVMAVIVRYQTVGFTHITLNTFDDELIGKFGSYGQGDEQFTWPTSLAFDRGGLLYVADEHANRISVFTTDPDEVSEGGIRYVVRGGQKEQQAGKLVSQWGTGGRAEGQLNGPSGIVFDCNEDLYIVDHRSHRIQKFTKDGKFLGVWGGFGDGEGEFNLPWGITLDHDGNVYVADWRNDRVQKFTAGGEFLASYGSTGDGNGQFNRPSSVAVDADGDIYVADWRNNRVQVIGADGRFVKSFHGDATASDLMRKDAVNGTLQPAMVKARFMADDPQSEEIFFGPVSVKLDGQGRLFVVDSYRFRIQVYQKEGYPSPVLFDARLDSEERILTL
jgi:DNA-binding beta-propeller fold protein YncE